MPWRQGALHNVSQLLLYGESDTRILAQHWVTARWPDGLAKWTVHAAFARSILKKDN